MGKYDSMPEDNIPLFLKAIANELAEKNRLTIIKLKTKIGSGSYLYQHLVDDA